MKTEIRIDDAADVCRIRIEGTIGVPEQCQFDEPDDRVATYERFREALRRIEAIEAPEVVVEIRSTGGDVNDALLIHDALCGLRARIVTRCYGYTASAATVIAQAASEGCRELSANALYLIHNAVCASEGNAAELAGTLDLLRKTDRRIAEVYAARSGRPVGEFERLMAANNGAGRWLAPEEALAAGLVDRIVEPPAAGMMRNIARGWERLLERAGWRRGGERPAARNVLHTSRNVLHTAGEAAPALRDGVPAAADPLPAAPDALPAGCDPLFSAGVPLPTPGRSLRISGESLPASGAASPAAEASPHDFPAAVAGGALRAEPTRVRPCEDPSCRESLLTPNQRAYAEDAKRFRSA